MRLSTRNQLKGTITEVDLGTVMAVVKIHLGLAVGQPATVFIKSTEVTIGVE
jgi:molybdopterin-binding protein